MSNPTKDQQQNWMTRNYDFTDPNIDHDRILVVEGQKFYVKSEFVVFHSEFFSALLNANSGFKEATLSEVEIKEVTAVECKDFLNIIYLKANTITADNYRSIISLAVRFLSGTVIQKCAQFMADNFDFLNVFDAIKIAFEYKMEGVKNKFAEFLRVRAMVKCKGCYAFRCHCKVYYLSNKHTMIHSQSFVHYERHEIAKLPLEIQAFILQVMLDIHNNC